VGSFIVVCIVRMYCKNSRTRQFCICSIELGIKDTTDTDRSASYLGLHLEIYSEGRLRTKHYDDFIFPIVKFPFRCSNIPVVSAYGVYISQLIWHARACCSDFLDRGLLLTRKLQNQWFLLVNLKSSLRTFYGRHHALVNHFRVYVSQFTTDIFDLSKLPTLPEHLRWPPVFSGVVLLDL